MRQEISRAKPPKKAVANTSRNAGFFLSMLGRENQTIGAAAIQKTLVNLNSLSRFGETFPTSPGRAVGPLRIDTIPDAKGMQATRPNAIWSCRRPFAGPTSDIRQ